VNASYVLVARDDETGVALWRRLHDDGTVSLLAQARPGEEPVTVSAAEISISPSRTRVTVRASSSAAGGSYRELANSAPVLYKSRRADD
jgi:hypothetical protein